MGATSAERIVAGRGIRLSGPFPVVRDGHSDSAPRSDRSYGNNESEWDRRRGTPAGDEGHAYGVDERGADDGEDGNEYRYADGGAGDEMDDEDDLELSSAADRRVLSDGSETLRSRGPGKLQAGARGLQTVNERDTDGDEEGVERRRSGDGASSDSRSGASQRIARQGNVGLDAARGHKRSSATTPDDQSRLDGRTSPTGTSSGHSSGGGPVPVLARHPSARAYMSLSRPKRLAVDEMEGEVLRRDGLGGIAPPHEREDDSARGRPAPHPLDDVFPRPPPRRSGAGPSSSSSGVLPSGIGGHARTGSGSTDGGGASSLADTLRRRQEQLRAAAAAAGDGNAGGGSSSRPGSPLHHDQTPDRPGLPRSRPSTGGIGGKAGNAAPPPPPAVDPAAVARLTSLLESQEASLGSLATDVAAARREADDALSSLAARLTSLETELPAWAGTAEAWVREYEESIRAREAETARNREREVRAEVAREVRKRASHFERSIRALEDRLRGLEAQSFGELASQAGATLLAFAWNGLVTVVAALAVVFGPAFRVIAAAIALVWRVTGFANPHSRASRCTRATGHWCRNVSAALCSFRVSSSDAVDEDESALGRGGWRGRAWSQDSGIVAGSGDFDATLDPDGLGGADDRHELHSLDQLQPPSNGSRYGPAAVFKRRGKQSSDAALLGPTGSFQQHQSIAGERSRAVIAAAAAAASGHVPRSQLPPMTIQPALGAPSDHQLLSTPPDGSSRNLLLTGNSRTSAGSGGFQMFAQPGAIAASTAGPDASAGRDVSAPASYSGSGSGEFGSGSVGYGPAAAGTNALTSSGTLLQAAAGQTRTAPGSLLSGSAPASAGSDSAASRSTAYPGGPLMSASQLPPGPTSQVSPGGFSSVSSGPSLPRAPSLVPSYGGGKREGPGGPTSGSAGSSGAAGTRTLKPATGASDAAAPGARRGPLPPPPVQPPLYRPRPSSLPLGT